MAKFMIFYNSTMRAQDMMDQATPEQIKTSMDEWIRWREESNQRAKVEFGLPLQALHHIVQGQTTDSSSQVSGYAIMEAPSKDTVVELLQSHPHLKRPGASIEVLEMLPIPGI